MHEEPRKLKRGLKDISPLFETQNSKADQRLSLPPKTLTAPLKTLTPNVSSEPSKEFQIISLWGADLKNHSLRLNRFAMESSRKNYWESVWVQITDEASKNSKLKLEETSSEHRLRLSEAQFEVLSPSKRNPLKGYEHASVFLEFEYDNPLLFERLIPALDKWVIVMSPELESLTESFRYLKAVAMLNKRVEYYLISQVRLNEEGELLFEKFSELVSRRLGFSLSWLGCADVAGGRFVDRTISWDVLLKSAETETRAALKSLPVVGVK